MAIDPVDLWRVFIAWQPWRIRSASLRKKADKARVKGRLSLAQALYRRYLKLRPDDPISWYMLGQVYRDRHRPTLAEPCYHRALALAPDHWRAHAAFGRFLKSTGRDREAHAALTRAVALGANEQTRQALRDVSVPGLRPDADAEPGAAMIWIDIADLLIFLRYNRHPSGIQRVQLELLRQAMARPGQAAIITTMPWDGRIWCLSQRRIAAMLRLLDSKGGGTAAMSAVIEDLLATAVEAAPQPGLVLFQPGAFWIGGGNPPLHHRVRAAGMKVVPLIHDLIPVRMPEVCVANLVEEFSTALGEAAHSFDAIIANSTHTATDIAAFMARHAYSRVPIVAVPLAHRLSEAPPAAPVWTKQIASLRDTPFVLCVGTIEPRKNQVLLLRVWAALLDQGLEPPLLVIAGKRGWLTDQFDAELEWLAALRKRVKIMSDLSDAEIDTLYSQCLFTSFPSLAEGWGLPVGESLARGRVCVCSDRDSMPEVGGAAAITIDPLDVTAATAVFRRLIFTPGALAQAERTLRENFRPRSWPEVTEAMFTALADLAGQPASELVAPVLKPGIRYRPSSRFGDDWPEPFVFQPRLMLVEGWWKPGPEGAFMAGDLAMLHLSVTEDGDLVLRFVAREPAELSMGAATLSLTLAQPTGMLIVPVKSGRLRLELRAKTGLGPKVPPGVWLTAVELRRVGL